jgi:hypothetical protein
MLTKFRQARNGPAFDAYGTCDGSAGNKLDRSAIDVRVANLDMPPCVGRAIVGLPVGNDRFVRARRKLEADPVGAARLEYFEAAHLLAGVQFDGPVAASASELLSRTLENRDVHGRNAMSISLEDELQSQLQ